MTRKSRPYREALLQALADPVEAAYYLTVALEDSPEMFRKACLNVIQARQVAKIAKDVGVSRESLYRSFSATGNPSQETVDSVLDALNLEYVGIRPKGVASYPAAPPSAPSISAGVRRHRKRRVDQVRPTQSNNSAFLMKSQRVTALIRVLHSRPARQPC